MKCKICDSTNLSVFEVKEMELGLREIFKYYYCNSCGSLQIEEIPKNLEKYYPQDKYYSLKENQKKSTIKKLLSKIRDTSYLNRYNFIGKFLDLYFPGMQSLKSFSKVYLNYNNILNKGSNILDVGCGKGHLIKKLAELGFCNLTGIDPFIDKDEKIGNIKILKKSIFEFKPEKKFNLVMFNHSFEHLTENPFQVLEKVYSLLEKDGLCLIRMPTTSSILWEKYRENWVGIQAPRHIILYSIRGIEYLAEKTNFNVDMIFYDSTEFSFIASEQYKRDISLNDKNSYFINPKKAPFSKEEIKKYKKLAKEYNEKFRGDMICIVMKK